MAKIVECIPNFSEGRNQAVIDGLVETAKSVPGVTLLDHSSDASHNRSVFTLVGDNQNIQEPECDCPPKTGHPLNASVGKHDW